MTGFRMDLKKYKRFFAFGCSITRYGWPTWADMIGQEIPNYINAGRPGAGNLYISSQIAEANQRYKFNEDDLVIVMWSTCTREDRYMIDRWVCPGNIYTQTYYDNKFIMNYVDDRGSLIRDMAQISLANCLLQISKAEYHMLVMQPFETIISDSNKSKDVYADVFELYKPIIDMIKHDMLNLGCNGKWPRIPIRHDVPGGQNYDYHPSPKTHFEFISKVFPSIVWSNETIGFMEHHERLVMKAKFTEELTYNSPGPKQL